MLARLHFHDYDTGVPLALEFRVRKDDRWKGTMSATFQREVELANLEGYRIRFATEESNSRTTGRAP